MPANQLPSQRYFSAIVIASLIASVAFFDFAIFLYLSDLLQHIFFGGTEYTWLSRLQLFGLFLAGYIARPLGGLMIGYYGDTKGRKPALFISILGVTIFTLSIGLLPQYSQIGFIAPIIFIIARVIQSLAIGGIMPSVWAYVTEHLPTRHIGIGCGTVLSGCVLSLIFLILLMNWLDGTLTWAQMMSFGWRIPFICGGLLSFILILISYKHLQETPIFLEAHSERSFRPETESMLSTMSLSALTSSQIKQLDHLPVIEFQLSEETKMPDHSISPSSMALPPKINGIDQRTITTAMRLVSKLTSFARSSISFFQIIFNKNMLISIIPAIILISIMVSLLIFTPILLVDLIDGSFRISETVLWFGNVLAILFMAIGCLIFGILVDRLNPGIVLTFGSLFLAMQVALFFNHLRNGGEYGLIFFALFGFASGIIGAIPSIVMRLFPVKIRLTSISIIYNIVIVLIGGLLPFVLHSASAHIAFAPMIFIVSLSLLTMFISFYIYYIPRTDLDMSR